MKNKYIFVLVLLAVILGAGIGLAAVYRHQQNPGLFAESGEEAEFTVVTSFYPMYIAAENVIGGCEGVRLENLSEPQTGCLHDYQLTTEDMRLLSTADVFIVNGGGIESFLTRVAEQYPELTIVYACEGIEMSGDNPHVWMNVEYYMEQVENIRDGLIASDESGDRVDTYLQNADVYLSELEGLAGEAGELSEKLSGQPVVLFHEAYRYLAEELGLYVAGVMDLDEERQVSAGEVADILSLISSEQVPVIFAEELYGREMGDRMEEETGVTVLYLDPLTRGDYDPDSYLGGMRKNLDLILQAYD